MHTYNVNTWIDLAYTSSLYRSATLKLLSPLFTILITCEVDIIVYKINMEGVFLTSFLDMRMWGRIEN